MRRYTTFHDHNVFEGEAHGLPEVEVKEAPNPYPIEPLPAGGLTVSITIPVTLGSTSATLSTSPAMSEEDSVAPVTTPAALADELANPPTPLKVASDTGSHP